MNSVYYTTRAGIYAAPVAYTDRLARIGATIERRGRKWVYFRYVGDWEQQVCGLGLAVPIDLIFEGFSSILAASGKR